MTITVAVIAIAVFETILLVSEPSSIKVAASIAAWAIVGFCVGLDLARARR